LVGNATVAVTATTQLRPGTGPLRSRYGPAATGGDVSEAFDMQPDGKLLVSDHLLVEGVRIPLVIEARMHGDQFPPRVAVDRCHDRGKRDTVLGEGVLPEVVAQDV
jgi:hypothetical protein